MKIKFLVFAFIVCAPSFAQNKLFTEKEIAINELIDGTLLLSNTNSNSTLAIFIGDFGPTDRNGNQNFLKSNTLKKLAEGLSYQGVSTFRYDKRIVKQIRKGKVDNDILFNDFITDAISVVSHFKSQNTYSKIYIIGYGQGSLVGMIAAQEIGDGFVSLAGSGQSLDLILRNEIKKNAPMFAEDTAKVLETLKAGKTTPNFPEALASIFSEELQPFLSSWIQFNPITEISKLNVPVLIINGTKDLQVSVEESEALKNASKNGSLKIIEKMNHILYTIEGDDLENSKSYNESFRKINPQVIEHLISFIK